MERKVWKDKYSARKVEITLTMLDETESKTMDQKKTGVMDRGKRSKILNLKLTVQLFEMIKKKSSELSKDKSQTNGRPSFTYTTRPCTWVTEFFKLKDDIVSLRVW